MVKKAGVHPWIIRIAVILAIPLTYLSSAFGLENDAYRFSIFLIIAIIAGVGLIFLRSFGRTAYLAVFGFVVFTYLFDMLHRGTLDIPQILADIISPYFLVPLVFGLYLFTSPVHRLLR